MTLSKLETAMLKKLDSAYKWIARDQNSSIYVYSQKPNRAFDCWAVGPIKHWCELPFKTLFQEITWETEPVEISTLIGENV